MEKDANGQPAFLRASMGSDHGLSLLKTPGKLADEIRKNYRLVSTIDQTVGKLRGLLARQGLDTNTIIPVRRADIPNGQVITYYNPQLKEKIKLSDNSTPHVEYRVRGTYGGNRSNYSGPVSNNTAEYPVVKILMNAALSDRIHKDPDTKFATADMVDFYLGTDLDEPGYMSIQADDIGNELIDLYNLSSYIVNVNGRR
jgi:hypothetical protein